VHAFHAHQTMTESFRIMHATCPAHITFLQLIILVVVLHEQHSPRSLSFAHSSAGYFSGSFMAIALFPILLYVLLSDERIKVFHTQ